MKKRKKHFFLPFFLLAMLILPLFPQTAHALAKGETVPCLSNVQVSSDGTDITVTWNDMGEDYYYRIEKSTNDIWNDDISESSDSSFTFSSLSMGEKYSFRVQTVYEYYEDDYDEDGLPSGQHLETIYSDWSDIVSIQLSYEAPNITSVKSSGAVQITLSWEAVPGAGGYRIYRSTTENEGYHKIKTITDADTLSYTDKKDLITGTTYYYKICTYNEDFTYPNGNDSRVFSAIPMPSRLKLSAKSAGYSSIQLNWKTEKGITGYILYRSDSKDGTFKKIKTITDCETTTYTNKKLTTGKSYYYKVKAYSTVDDTTYKGSASSAAKAVPAVLAPTISSIKMASVTKATLTWTKISGASGYVIYRSSSKDGTYEKIGKVKDGKTVTYTASGLSNGKTYYFKVRAYRTVDGSNYCGAYSAAKRKLMNKLAYAGEPYESRCNRIWKTDYYKDYTSSSAAKADMKTITVKTWDINSSGKKYTRSFELTVHKNIASTVQQIFKEIYNGKEKFPIHAVGGYSWRGDSSTSEHCEGLAIDINPDENYMINKTDGTILSGKLYKPGENPYSIPENGDVVKAFEKYGFYWGDWSTKRDYMHFSYFGN